MSHEGASTAAACPVERWVRCVLAVARRVFCVGTGLLLWMFGLLALDVPADLPHWRIIAGEALLVFAVHLFQWAALITTADNPEAKQQQR